PGLAWLLFRIGERDFIAFLQIRDHDERVRARADLDRPALEAAARLHEHRRLAVLIEHSLTRHVEDVLERIAVHDDPGAQAWTRAEQRPIERERDVYHPHRPVRAAHAAGDAHAADRNNVGGAADRRLVIDPHVGALAGREPVAIGLGDARDQ